MSKSAYTDEEIKNVFHALFTEKKRIKELEQQLDQLRQGTPTAVATATSNATEEENNKLRLMLASLKSQYDELKKNAATPPAPAIDTQTDQELNKQKELLAELQENTGLLEEENKAFHKQLDALKTLLMNAKGEVTQANKERNAAQEELKKAKQEFEKTKALLQAEALRVPDHVNAAVKTNLLDFDSLREENKNLKVALAESEEQNHRHKIRLEKLAQSIQEKERRIHELHQYEFTHKKTTEQRQDLQNSLETIEKEREKLQHELTESRLHSEQLERVIKFLRERSEEGQLTSQQFKEDFETAQETIHRLEAELQNTHEQLNTIKHSAIHVENDKSELYTELSRLRAEHQALKATIDDSQNGNRKLESALNEAEKIAQQEQENALQMAEKLTHQNSIIENARKEIDIIKQALIRGMREANEMEARYRESVQEKVAALNKFHHARQQLEKQEQDARRQQEEFKQAQTAAEGKLAQALELCYMQEESSRTAIEDLQKAWHQDKQESLAREQRLQAHFAEEQKQMQEDHRQTLDKLQNDLERIKDENHQHVNGLMLQIGQLKTELEAAVNVEVEKQALLEQYEHLKRDLTSAGQRLEETLQAREELDAALKALSDRCQEKEKERSEAQEHINRLTKEKHQLSENLASTRAEMEEKESHIKMAQQHLAKKVKEGALLNDEIDKYKQQTQEMQQQLMHNQIRIAELQASVDIHSQQEKRLQDQLQEVARNYEAQVKKWEHKYFEMQDRWQATELRKKELERLEERHMQMQALLSNLGSVLNTPVAPSAPSPYLPPTQRYEEPPYQPQAYVPEAPQQAQPQIVEEYQQEPNVQKPYQNLFNMPKAQDKPRQNLFD